MDDEDAFKSMYGIAEDLGKDVFDAKNLLKLKRLATAYDFALDLNVPDAVVAAESKVATFLADAIGGAEDEDKADAIRDIADAMVELRDEEDRMVAERERLDAEAEGEDGAGDQN